MLFRQLIDALKKKDFTKETVERFGLMLDDAGWMFSQAAAVAEQRTPAEQVRDDLYRRDRQINQSERIIREKIVIHLSAETEPDVGISLVLMSVVKDAERIGDYCKNIFEVGAMFRGKYIRAEYAEPLVDIRKEAEQLFQPVKQSFMMGEKKRANVCVETSQRLRQQCELLTRQLLTPGGSAAPDEAAALALRARHLKRVIAHLGNIATSVSNPVPMLDYKNGKPLDEPEGE